jgi:hypothetical protein
MFYVFYAELSCGSALAIATIHPGDKASKTLRILGEEFCGISIGSFCDRAGV